ncbi:MAG: hypothetical protein HW400_74 [Candidatus Levybacteria bacterium]|nr:hypothetical protein [Candidatus Levybacteria bacterium]
MILKRESKNLSHSRPISYGMKILIGTPIHQIKDYCMERWLQNVAKLQAKSPTDLLLVDNSPGLDYVEKVKGYCAKYGITNYKIEHLEINQNQPVPERIGRSREIIRQEILANDYDAWFSWESDQIIPVNALGKLVKIMEAGSYMMIHPNSWTRVYTGEPDADFGICLIKRECLEKYGFLLEYPDMPDCYAMGEAWFKKQVLKGGGSYIEVYGLIKPIYHLSR